MDSHVTGSNFFNQVNTLFFNYIGNFAGFISTGHDLQQLPQIVIIKNNIQSLGFYIRSTEHVSD